MNSSTLIHDVSRTQASSLAPDALGPTQILANQSRHEASQFCEALTDFSSGWVDNSPLPALLEFIAPSVPTGRRFEYRQHDQLQGFLAEHDDVRAIGAAFKRVEYGGQIVQEKTLNKGLTVRVDHDEVFGDNWHERYVQLLLQRLYRNELIRALSLMAEKAKATEVNLGQAGHGDVDALLRKALVEGADQSGVRVNRLLFAETAWDLRASAYAAQDNAGAYYAAGLTPPQVAQKLLVDALHIVTARYQAEPDAKKPLLQNVVYGFCADSGLTKEQPSHLKRFYTPIEGQAVAVYMEEHPKYTDITVEHYSNTVLTSALGLCKITLNPSA
jgi:hypothetical protein